MSASDFYCRGGISMQLFSEGCHGAGSCLHCQLRVFLLWIPREPLGQDSAPSWTGAGYPPASLGKVLEGDVVLCAGLLWSCPKSQGRKNGLKLKHETCSVLLNFCNNVLFCFYTCVYFPFHDCSSAQMSFDIHIAVFSKLSFISLYLLCTPSHWIRMLD